MIVLILAVIRNYGQDVQFSQIFSDRMYLNPAFAGTDYCPKFGLSYRNQWPGIQFPFVTYSASFDKYSEAMHGGIGARVMKDDQGGGVFTQFNADLIYSYHLKISPEIKAKFAFEVSFYQQKVNSQNLIFADMIDPLNGIVYPGSEAINIEPFFSPDFSSAFLLHIKKYFVGVSVAHIPQSYIDMHDEILPIKYTVHAGTILPILKNGANQTQYFLEPNVLYINQQNVNMLYYGMYFDISKMSLGLFYRQNLNFHFDAMIISYHLNVKKMTIGYSYDITLSKFIRQTLGTHELSLSYIIPCDKKIRNYNTISCPTF